MHEKYDSYIRGVNETTDVPMERYGSEVSVSAYPPRLPAQPNSPFLAPSNLPWSLPAEAEPATASEVVGDAGLEDTAPQHELHSGTKFHQAGGIYETYGSSEPDDNHGGRT